VARENGQQGASSVDLASVHLEQLPAYEATSEAPREAPYEADGPVIHSPIPVRRGSVIPATTILGPVSQAAPLVPPAPLDEPPPDYEETLGQAPESRS